MRLKTDSSSSGNISVTIGILSAKIEMTSLQDRNSLAIEYEGQNSFGNDDSATNIVKCTITKIPLSSSASTVASFNCQS
jgi:hypothetical protein